MKNTCVNAYIFQAWLDLLADSHLEAFIVIDPLKTDREITIPMDYCVDGTLTLNTAPRTLGYFNLDKESGYLMLSTRFNRINQEMEIPVESIVAVKSPCGKIVLSMQEGLQLIGDQNRNTSPSLTIREESPNVNVGKSTLRVIR